MTCKHKILDVVFLDVVFEPIHIRSNRLASGPLRMSRHVHSLRIFEVVELELPGEVAASRAVNKDECHKVHF